MAIMEATLTQTYFGQTMQTRFNYHATGTPSAVSYSFALTSAMGAIYDQIAVPPAYPDALMSKIADIQTEEVSFVSLVVRDVNSVTDFFEQPFVQPLTGVWASGSGASPALAVGFRSNRTRTDIRPGQKRFGGISENIMDSGGEIDSAVAAAEGAALEAALGEVVTYDDSGNTLTFAPCVVKKEKYVIPGSDPERYAYRYYKDQAIGEANIMTSILWTLKPQVRTQTSRQYGRGI